MMEMVGIVFRGIAEELRFGFQSLPHSSPCNMAYISSDGKVAQSKPFGLSTILAFFIGIIDFILYFFKSLFGLTPEKDSSAKGGHVPNRKNTGGFFGSNPSAQARPFGGNPGVGGNVRSMSSFKTNTNFSTCPGGMCGGGQ